MEDYVTRLLRKMARRHAYEAVQSILAGNDTGCFTTDQYEAAWYRVEERHFPEREPLDLDRALGEGWGRTHLGWFPDLVQEVAPDVWSYVG